MNATTLVVESPSWPCASCPLNTRAHSNLRARTFLLLTDPRRIRAAHSIDINSFMGGIFVTRVRHAQCRTHYQQNMLVSDHAHCAWRALWQGRRIFRRAVVLTQLTLEYTSHAKLLQTGINSVI